MLVFYEPGAVVAKRQDGFRQECLRLKVEQSVSDHGVEHLDRQVLPPRVTPNACLTRLATTWAVRG